ncbi:LysR substrate-binding domain-containing protein [Leisingera thetidis]|uniref:LysR substrate-binding domain-containing protein n=1 Tax=Leisingera thetidis TaxID=2930199 RepID=UPI0021F7B380|nr:LysR substrate-binding domain-containing protein [Leisingera thetidis]
MQSLKLFDAVVRHRSMTRAAAEIGISQSAVSQSVRQLEDFVQVPLLDRSSRPMVLTDEGERFYRASLDSLGRLSQAVEDLRRQSRGDGKTVTISCNLGFATYWLMPRLNFFSADCPDIAVNVMAAYHGAAGLQSGTDIAIRYGDGSWPDGDWQLLFKETIVPICSAGYLERAGQITGAEQLSRQRLIHVTGTTPDWLGWEYYFKRLGHGKLPVPGGLRFSNYVQAVQTALSGEGIMLGWRSVAADLLKSQQLTIAYAEPIRLASGYYIRSAGNQDDGSCAGKFLGWLKQQTSRTPDF